MSNKVADEGIIQLIQELSESKGAPGFEHETAQIVQRYGQKYGQCRRDLMQNVYLQRAGASRDLKIQLDAHLDEVGFMVQSIQANGLLRLQALGGWVASNVAAQHFLVHNRAGRWLDALTVSKPPHYLTESERQQPVRLEDILLDVGASSLAEAQTAFGIEIGEPVVPASRFSYVKEHDLLLGKAFDCRLGCAALLLCLAELADSELDCEVEAAFATQEECGTRGATVTTQNVRPDLALVFEGCPADDSFAPPELSQTAIGKGPMLRHLDARMITHPGLQHFALQVAERQGLAVQRAVRSGGSTNAAPIHLGAKAPACLVIGIPVRYIHTGYGFAKLSDVKGAAHLAAELIRALNREKYSELLTASSWR